MGIHQNGYDLEYLPDAHSWVDPIKTLPGLLGQRKRWINGSFFAFEKVKTTLSKDSSGDCCLKLQIGYLSFMNTIAYFAPSLFLFTLHIAMYAFRDWAFYALQVVTQGSNFQSNAFYDSFVYAIDFIYVISFLGFVLRSIHLTHRNKKFIPYIYGISTFMGIASIIVFIVLLYDMISGFVDKDSCNFLIIFQFWSITPFFKQDSSMLFLEEN